MARSVFLSAVLALGLFPSTLAAQSTSTISGTIADPLDAPIRGASVELLRDGAFVDSTTTGADGSFTFENIPEGRYQVRATSPGFQTRTRDVIFVGRGGAARAELTLPIGPLETAVSVTAAATDVLPSQIGAAVTVIDARTLAAIGKVDVLEALRQVPGSSLVQTGGRGGITSMFVRGGNSNFNKVLIDGVPANDIGGAIDLSQFATTGVDRIETLREANSVIAGTDALAGVISITTRRGSTRVPQLIASLDGGSLSTDRESAGIGGAYGRIDYFSEFSHFATDNDVANNRYRNKTYAGRFDARLGSNTDLSGTVRWIDKYYESPNAIQLYGVADDYFQTNRYHFIGLGSQTQITDRWTASARVGLSDQRMHYQNPTVSGTVIGGIGFGNVVTITGANGAVATGRAALDYSTYTGDSRSARQGLYAQTTYQILRNLSVSGGGDYERERAFTNPNADPTTTRNNGTVWTEGRGSLADRASVTAGIGHAHIEGFASRWSPRISVAAYLRKPRAQQFWSDTRLTFNAGKGIKAASVTAVASSLDALLRKTPAGQALAQRAGIGAIGPERGRNIDVGLEQGVWGGRVRGRVSYFNNEFYDLVEFVSRTLLPTFGIAPDVALAAGNGAYLNSQSYRAQGVEFSADAQTGRVRLAASYTHLDAEVLKSLSSNVTPLFNPNLPGVPIGGYSPLVGQRPFRRPANTGSLLVSYVQGPVALTATGYLAGKSDDSTFLVGSDLNFGNTLLLPNHNLNFGYAKLDVSASYQIKSTLKPFVTVENLLDQDYQPAFGFPALPFNVRVGVTVQLGGR